MAKNKLHGIRCIAFNIIGASQYSFMYQKQVQVLLLGLRIGIHYKAFRCCSIFIHKPQAWINKFMHIKRQDYH